MAFSLNSTNFSFSGSLSVPGYPFSLIGWFRVPNVTSPAFLMGLINFSSGESCDILFAGDSTKEAVAKTTTGSSSGSAYSSSPMIPGQWHHLVAVFASDGERKIFLDGDNLGVNNDNLPISMLNTFYFGNPFGSDYVDVADVSFVQTAVSAEQAAILASGGPVLALPNFRDVLAYHDCIRQVNRPGLGPDFTVTGTPTVVDHPRMLFPVGGYSTTMPKRIRGPFHMGQGIYRSLSDEQGQLAVAGVVSNNAILSGEVIG